MRLPKGADAAIICCDLISKERWNSIDFWFSSIKENAAPNCKMYLVGTKKDMVGSYRLTSIREEMNQISQRLSGQTDHDVSVFETSSKSGENVSTVFEKVASDYSSNERIDDEIKPVECVPPTVEERRSKLPCCT